MSRETSRRRERRGGPGLRQLPWRNQRNPYKPIEVLSADQLEAIHQTLAADPRGARHRVPGRRVPRAAAGGRRGCGAGLEPASALRPQSGRGEHRQGAVGVHAPCAQPERNLTFGGNNINFGSVASAPMSPISIAAGGPAISRTTATCCGCARAFNVVQFIGGYPVEPADMPPATRHLDAHYAAITLTDRVWHPYSLGQASASPTRSR